jgi:hypothetical protein
MDGNTPSMSTKRIGVTSAFDRAHDRSGSRLEPDRTIRQNRPSRNPHAIVVRSCRMEKAHDLETSS